MGWQTDTPYPSAFPFSLWEEKKPHQTNLFFLFLKLAIKMILQTIKNIILSGQLFFFKLFFPTQVEKDVENC